MEEALRVAAGFQPLSESDVSGLLARTEERARRRERALQDDDGVRRTTQNPEWLG